MIPVPQIIMAPLSEVVVLVALVLVARASGLSLPPMYGSSMVFQHSEPVVVWGYATPGVAVSVSLTLPGATAKATPNGAGVWTATLPPQAPSMTPATITVTSGADTVVLADVLFGMVFICSGQSECTHTAARPPDPETTPHATAHLHAHAVPTSPPHVHGCIHVWQVSPHADAHRGYHPLPYLRRGKELPWLEGVWTDVAVCVVGVHHVCMMSVCSVQCDRKPSQSLH
jgi:hypothetical protein